MYAHRTKYARLTHLFLALIVILFIWIDAGRIMVKKPDFNFAFGDNLNREISSTYQLSVDLNIPMIRILKINEYISKSRNLSALFSVWIVPPNFNWTSILRPIRPWLDLASLLVIIFAGRVRAYSF